MTHKIPKERYYKLTTTGTVAALNVIQKPAGFIFYTRIFWGQNPDMPAIVLINKVLESIPEPWRNNIPEDVIQALKGIAENRTGKEALDELIKIRHEAGVE